MISLPVIKCINSVPLLSLKNCKYEQSLLHYNLTIYLYILFWPATLFFCVKSIQFALMPTAKQLIVFESGGLGSLTSAEGLSTVSSMVRNYCLLSPPFVLWARNIMWHTFNFSFSMLCQINYITQVSICWNDGLANNLTFSSV